MCETNGQHGKGSDKTETMKDKLELQLHEQYAINNNANVSSFIAMIGALIIAFTGYGYVLYQYLMDDWCGLCCCGKAHATTMMHIATFAVLAVIFILYVVALNLGTGQRMEQFITFAIRKTAYKDKTDTYKEIYPKSYHPFNKTIWKFTQGMYNSLLYIFLIVYVTIGIYTALYVLEKSCYLLVYALPLVGIITITCYKYYSYIKREEAYVDKVLGFLTDTDKDFKKRDYDHNWVLRIASIFKSKKVDK